MSDLLRALTASEQAALYAAGAHATRRYFIPVKPREVFSGQITAAPSYPRFGEPIAELAIGSTTGSAADAAKNMDVWIGTAAGKADVATLRVRKTPTTSVLYVGEQGSGDPGSRALLTHHNIAAGMFFTVVESFSMWYVFPRIALEVGDGTHYKDFDDPYTDQTAQPAPVANLGPFRWGFVDGGGVLQVTLSAADSFPMAPGASIAGYAWSIGTGTLIDGALTDAEITVEFPAGQHWPTCTVTDSGGKTAQGRVLVAALTSTGEHAPMAVLEPPASDTRDERGRRLSLRLDPAEATLARLPHGAMAVYVEENTIAGEDAPCQSGVMVGWALRESVTAWPPAGEHAIELVGPGHLLNELPAVPQLYQEAATPTAWHQVIPDLCHVMGAVWYLLKFHCPPLLDVFDFVPAGAYWNDTRQKGFKLGGATVSAQIDEVCRAVPAAFGAASDGSLILARRPEYAVARADQVTRITLTPAAWSSFDAARQSHNRVGLVYADAFKYPQEPLQAQAPDKAPGQGAGKASLEGMIVPGPDTLRWLAGMHLAKENNPYPDIRIALPGCFDVVEPVAQQWIEIEVPADMLDETTGEGQMWLRFFNLTTQPESAATLRVLARSVAVSHAPGYKEITLTAAAETFGQQGVLLPIQQALDPYRFNPNVGGIPDGAGGWAFEGVPFEPFEAPLPVIGVEPPQLMPPVYLEPEEARWPEYDDPAAEPEYIVAMNDGPNGASGEMAIARTGQLKDDDTTEWELIDTGVTGGNPGALAYDVLRGMLLMTNDEGLWKCENPWEASPTWTLVSVHWAGCTELVPSRLENGLLAGVSSVEVLVSLDGGETIEHSYDFPANPGEPHALALNQGAGNPGVMYLAIYDSTSNTVFKSDDYGDTWQLAGLVTGWWASTSIFCPARLDVFEENTDGEYLCVARYENKPSPTMGYFESEDGGDTWSDFIPIEHPDTGQQFGPHFLPWSVFGDHEQFVLGWNFGNAISFIRRTNAPEGDDWAWMHNDNDVNGMLPYPRSKEWFLYYGYNIMFLTRDAFETAPAAVYGDFAAVTGAVNVQAAVINPLSSRTSV